jgi:uncharacterized repeat protein (TIGR02543 family)
MGAVNPDTITVDGPKSVTAVFTETFSLNISTDGEGSVTADPDQERYASGTEVRIEATPAENWEFDRWEGGISSSENPETVLMDENKSVTAVFEQKTFPVETSADGQGSVETTLLSGEELGGEFTQGAEVEVTAQPAEGWKFQEWQGDLMGAVNPDTITVDGPKSITAVFETGPFTVTLDSEPGGAASKSPDKEEYALGETVTLNASVFEGFTFGGWTGDVQDESQEITVEVTDNLTTTATFDPVKNEGVSDDFLVSTSVENGLVQSAEAEITAGGTASTLDIYDETGEFLGSVGIGFTFSGFLNVGFSFGGDKPTPEEFEEYYVIFRLDSGDHTIVSDGSNAGSNAAKNRKPEDGRSVEGKINIDR